MPHYTTPYIPGGFVCPVCKTPFNYERGLHDHMKIHTDAERDSALRFKPLSNPLVSADSRTCNGPGALESSGQTASTQASAAMGTGTVPGTVRGNAVPAYNATHPVAIAHVYPPPATVVSGDLRLPSLRPASPGSAPRPTLPGVRDILAQTPRYDPSLSAPKEAFAARKLPAPRPTASSSRQANKAVNLVTFSQPPSGFLHPSVPRLLLLPTQEKPVRSYRKEEVLVARGETYSVTYEVKVARKGAHSSTNN